MKRPLASLLVLAVGACTAFALISCGTTSMGSTPRPIEMKTSTQYDLEDKSFVNSVETRQSISFKKLRGVIKRYRENVQTPPGPIPLAKLAADDFGGADGVQITWIGHSTMLIEIEGFRVLTDPVWSKRVSPFQFVGPSRFHEPPIAIDKLPDVDAVIISHDHYDHLDHDTVEHLSWKGVKFFVPLGVGAHFEKWGIQQVTELDWWESVTLERGGKTVELVATPARHFSGRGMLDRNHTLWASWVVRTDNRSVYFGGDTGYFDGFTHIGQKYGPFDATLMPIGAYDEAWQEIHLNPEEAVQAHHDLGNTGVFVPIHYATFNLAAHGWEEPMERLLTAAADGGVGRYAFPLPGQRFDSSEPSLHQTWWRNL